MAQHYGLFCDLACFWHRRAGGLWRMGLAVFILGLMYEIPRCLLPCDGEGAWEQDGGVDVEGIFILSQV